MLLIRELSRVVRDLLAFAVGTRRVGVVLLVAVVALVAGSAAAVTHLGPIVVYPLL